MSLLLRGMSLVIGVSFTTSAHALVARSTLLAQAEAKAAADQTLDAAALSGLSRSAQPGETAPQLGVQSSGPQAEVKTNNPATYDRNQALKQYASVRDPFKRPNFANSDEPQKSPLELFAVDQMRVVGVLTGPKRMRAILRLPDGQTHIVTDKMKIGVRNGVIQRVTPKGVRVVEKIVNIIGEEEVFETDILLNESTAAADSGNPEG